MIKDLILGNKLFQPFFEFLFKVAYKGMNYDRGHVPGLSGERYVLKMLENLNKDKQLTIFDVGGNVGQYATLVMETINKPLVLHSFEPQEAAFNKLREVSNKDFFKPNNFALGSKAEVRNIFYPEKGSVFASLHKTSYPTYNIDLTDTHEVSVKTLDDYCKQNNINQIDFLKMDVEGHEIEVLKGSQEMLAANKIKMVQFEFGVSSIASRVYLKDFFDILKGFEIYRILQNGIRKLHYSEYIEIFSPTNYLAIYKGNRT